MPTSLFKYKFDLKTESSQNAVIEAVNKGREVLPVPVSHFFTELPLEEQIATNSFRPQDLDASQNATKFRVTSKFTITGDTEKNAYATVDGLLFIAPHGTSTDKVNVFLKPAVGHICDIGVKVKYFVYRGILRKNLFTDDIADIEVIKDTDVNATRFIKKVWDEYKEFNFPDAQSTDGIVFLAEQLKFTLTQNEKLKTKFYKKNSSSNLGLIRRGEKIGAFKNIIGFEIVLDYGDSELEKAETGFELDEEFVLATECVFNLNTSEALTPYVYGSNCGEVDHKIFKENILHFMDPASFYGAHITEDGTSPNKGIVYHGHFVEENQTPTKYDTKEGIYDNIVHKFGTNKDRVYLYILGKRGRSFNFYSASASNTPITINDNDYCVFGSNNWPIIILNSSDVGQYQYSEIKLKFNNLDANPNDLFLSKDSNQVNYWNGFEEDVAINDQPFSFKKPNINGNQNIANFIFLSFEGDTTKQNYLDQFGPINLSPIFEKGDFQGASSYTTYQWISYLKPKLFTINKESFLFETKVVFFGSDGASNPSLKLFILYPKEKAQEYNNPNLEIKKLSAHASGYGSINIAENTSEEKKINFGKLIFNDSNIAIWKGKITDNGINIKVLTLRNLINDDFTKYCFQIGITQADINAIKTGLPASTILYNEYFKLDDVVLPNVKNFKKYRLGIAYDDDHGILQTHFPATDLFVYTIDGHFFSTIDYANQCQHTQSMADSIVELLPTDTWDGEFGFDWMRKTSNSSTIYPAYDQITGTVPTQVDGNNDDSTGFVFDPQMYNDLKINEYNVLPILRNLLSNTDNEYFIPTLSLAQGQTANLKLKIRIMTTPEKLYIKYHRQEFVFNNDINDSHAEIKNNSNLQGNSDPYKQFVILDKSLGERSFTFSIKCLKTFTEDVFLDVLAKEAEGTRLAGRIRIAKNIPIEQKILFVPVQIKFPSTTVIKCYNTTRLNFHKTSAETFLKQSCIQANISLLPLGSFVNVDGNLGVLDLQSDAEFYQKFTENNKIIGFYKNDDNSPITPDCFPPDNIVPDIKAYLMTKLTAQYPSLVIDSKTMVVYFIDAVGNSKSLPSNALETLNGFSGGVDKDVLIFILANDNNESVAHEIYHSLGLPHTFDKLDKNSKYVFEGRMTDNLLDYSHKADKPRRSTFYWQWQLARKSVSNYARK